MGGEIKRAWSTPFINIEQMLQSCSDIRQRWSLLELQKAVCGGIYLRCSAESQESCAGDVQQQGHVLEWMCLAAGPA